ncbi:replication factor C subunit 5-like [Paramacrobiotus metropolitanus]|uniref:replication factor C subunit 5-like n=1 Tax=Paramacrobiotus metropolitanus TaxID=2943436 RepID=UPI0024462F37|nr:replication factor C subunit 5-like [Paramacrobiotus metropolitanus]
MGTLSNTLPWVERYRPSALTELISHDNILSTLQTFLKEDRLPHLLFYGPPGTGKTSTILAIIKQLYEPREIPSLVLELNASDDRGIDIVRTEIVDFVSAKNVFSNKIKLVILDEADSMTKDAQNALRRVIEKYTNHCRFCIIANYLSKIIPAIQSRCTRFRFAPLTMEQIQPRLEVILKKENARWDDSGMNAILSLAKGDMRKALNLLQCTWMAYANITADNVYSCAGHPLQSEIETAVTTMMNKPFSEAADEVDDLRTGKCYAVQDILENIHSFVGELELPGPVRIYLLEKMADIEHRLASGCNEKIQLSSLVAAFYVARNKLSKFVV